MMALFATLGAILIASILAALGGLAIGYVAFAWHRGRAASTFLTEARGGLISYVFLPVVVFFLHPPLWIAVGLVTGVAQAAAVGRWIARPGTRWSSALLGDLALGHSEALLRTREAAARGAVTGTVAVTALHVVTLEAILSFVVPFGAANSIGNALVRAPSMATFANLVILGGIVVLGEVACSHFLQGKPLVRRATE
jgi:hypothetical protein